MQPCVGSVEHPATDKQVGGTDGLRIEQDAVFVEGTFADLLGDLIERAWTAPDELGAASSDTSFLCPSLSSLTSARDGRVGPDEPSSGAGHGKRPVPVWVEQREKTDCGVASLAMIARSYGLDVSLEHLRAIIRVEANGTSLAELRRGAERLGLRSRAVRMDLARPGEIEVPAIVHLRAGHYVVLYEARAEEVVIGDPATGIARRSRAALAEAASGNVLLIEPPASSGRPSR
jgi:hypothetical protein